MANLKISQLPSVNSIAQSDLLPVVASGVTSQITSANLFNSITSSQSISSSYSNSPVQITGSTIYSNTLTSNVLPYNNIIFGVGAGSGSFAVSQSNFIGYQAGYQAYGSTYSNFVGYQAGYQDSGSDNSNFIGRQAGYQVVNSDLSNFVGYQSAYQSSGSDQSNFIGYFSGYQSINADNSNFLGSFAGYKNSGSAYSTFIGYGAGSVTGSNVSSSGNNNILIGTSVTLPVSYNNGINIGGLIFGSGSYFNTSIVSSGSAGGNVGINQPNPQYSLDVNGTGSFSGTVVLSKVSSSFNFVNDSAAAAGGIPLGGLYRSGSYVLIRLA